MTKPELLSPARDAEQLIMALTYGADAVYLGGRRFGLRASAGNFGSEELADTVALCHKHGAKAFITCNAVLNNDDALALPKFLEEISDADADAIIVSDIGALVLARRYAPSVSVHISTQAGVFNYESARAFHDLGASRVILARELPISEIAKLRANTPPELELEAFVHGSMCVAISGRCLLSNYLTGRDANRGECAQPCRWKYSLIEHQRPGVHYDITEDDGTYIMNSRDLCMIDHIKDMMDAGVYCLKIEGRMKSAYYAAVVTNAYRKAIDAAVAGTPLKPVWSNEVNNVSHREYSTGFYYDSWGPGQYHGDSMYRKDCDVVAVVESCDAEGNAVLTQRNKFFCGDNLELLTPTDEPITFKADAITGADGQKLESTPHPMMELRIKLPFHAPRYSILRKHRN
ncbi:MAG: U32 family peptidase [Oscillospiraceae bacterium]|nr:U32 family peptidase [Oscillospiraceae bacterium]MCL2227704.1 U32 family peptidase [Oscillospiraceae bacterium]